jgi:hypothetical protein
MAIGPGDLLHLGVRHAGRIDEDGGRVSSGWTRGKYADELDLVISVHFADPCAFRVRPEYQRRAPKVAFDRALRFDRTGHAVSHARRALATNTTHRAGQGRTTVKTHPEGNLTDRKIGFGQQRAGRFDPNPLMVFTNR